MNAVVVVGVGLPAWTVVAVLVSLVLGAVIRRRDEQRPGPAAHRPRLHRRGCRAVRTRSRPAAPAPEVSSDPPY